MIELECVKHGPYFTVGSVYKLREVHHGYETYDDDGDLHEFTWEWVPCGRTGAKFEEVCDSVKLNSNPTIEYQQRLEELTEWCRNKPEDAAVRIMTAEKLGDNL